jgi:hypothetical protein
MERNEHIGKKPKQLYLENTQLQDFELKTICCHIHQELAAPHCQSNYWISKQSCRAANRAPEMPPLAGLPPVAAAINPVPTGNSQYDRDAYGALLEAFYEPAPGEDADDGDIDNGSTDQEVESLGSA